MKYKAPSECRDVLRADYTEYTAGSCVVGMIQDPENERAWIQSTETVSVEP